MEVELNHKTLLVGRYSVCVCVGGQFFIFNLGFFCGDMHRGETGSCYIAQADPELSL